MSQVCARIFCLNNWMYSFVFSRYMYRYIDFNTQVWFIVKIFCMYTVIACLVWVLGVGRVSVFIVLTTLCNIMSEHNTNLSYGSLCWFISNAWIWGNKNFLRVYKLFLDLVYVWNIQYFISLFKFFSCTCMLTFLLLSLDYLKTT